MVGKSVGFHTKQRPCLPACVVASADDGIGEYSDRTTLLPMHTADCSRENVNGRFVFVSTGT